MRKLDQAWTLIHSEHVTEMQALHDLDWHHPNSHLVQVPNTVFGALVEDGTHKDPFWGKNLESFDQTPYQSPWIYRKVFDLDLSLPRDYVEITLEGFNFRVNVWVNGTQVGSADELVGPYRIYSLDITQVVKPSDNVLVIEAIRPEADDLTIGWVDWNAYPPDDNLGLWRPVQLRQTGWVSVEDVFVQTKLNLETLEEAWLEVTAELVNHSDAEQSGFCRLAFADCIIEVPFSLSARERLALKLDASSHPQLHLRKPAVWWPHSQGEQPLYNLHAEVFLGGQLSDENRLRFGIREVESYINEQGHRGWKVNGKEILIRGAGWVDDLFLREDTKRVEAQVRYAKHMNLNTIRLEGFWGASKTLFDLCDELGMLLMIGWSCHWEWKGYCNREEDNYLLIKTPDEIAFHAKSFAEQVLWLRNHPSIFCWVFGSDMIPRPELETALYEELDKVDATRPRLVGCRQKSQDGLLDFTSEISGPVAVKMVGPYSYVTPNYWSEDRQLGGAFGFNTETGPGLQPVLYESLVRFTPENELWPINDTWRFHTGRGSTFTSFDSWLTPFNARYGEASDAEDFCFRAQMANYEAIRPMFEAFAVNKPEATGVIQWMLNSALPNHLWQLYDYYLLPNGAFYGTRKACEPLNVVFNYADRGIYLTNEHLCSYEGLSIEARAYDMQSRLIWSGSFTGKVEERSSSIVSAVPTLEDLDEATYFLDLRLRRSDGALVANNFYWLSTKPDVCDYGQSDWQVTPNTAYADLTGTRKLPPVAIEASYALHSSDREVEVRVNIKNPSEQLAFFLELSVVNPETGSTLVPVFWEDNYFSLLPGESRVVCANLSHDLVGVNGLECRMRGMNCEPATLKRV